MRRAPAASASRQHRTFRTVPVVVLCAFLAFFLARRNRSASTWPRIEVTAPGAAGQSGASPRSPRLQRAFVRAIADRRALERRRGTRSTLLATMRHGAGTSSCVRLRLRLGAAQRDRRQSKRVRRAAQAEPGRRIGRTGRCLSVRCRNGDNGCRYCRRSADERNARHLVPASAKPALAAHRSLP